MSEEWRAVVGYAGLYEVSDYGHVRSLDRTVIRKDGRRPYRKRGRIMSMSPNTSGHLQVTLSRNGQYWFPTVHQLVMEAFHGRCPDGLQILHWDDNPSNNRLENLRYGTHSDNMQDSVRNGRNHHARKVTCKWGHPFDANNTIWRKTGGRDCRKCRSRRCSEWRSTRANPTATESVS